MESAMLMRLGSLLAERLKARRDLVTLGVQGVIVDDARRVLLIRHGYRPGWHFPGGGVERHEGVETALKREIDEETGIILSEPFTLYGIYANFDFYPRDHVLLFIASQWRQARVIKPNAEIVEAKFFSLDVLPDNLAAAPRRRIGEIFGGAAKSLDW